MQFELQILPQARSGGGFAIAVHAGDVAAVPEPQTCALVLMSPGTAAAAARRRR